jgi:hypothetical protein
MTARLLTLAKKYGGRNAKAQTAINQKRTVCGDFPTEEAASKFKSKADHIISVYRWI